MGVTGSMGGDTGHLQHQGVESAKVRTGCTLGTCRVCRLFPWPPETGAWPGHPSDVAAMHRESPPQALWGPRVSQGHGLELLGNVLVFVHVPPGWAQAWSGRGHREPGWVWKGHSWLTSVHDMDSHCFSGHSEPRCPIAIFRGVCVWKGS